MSLECLKATVEDIVGRETWTRYHLRIVFPVPLQSDRLF